MVVGVYVALIKWPLVQGATLRERLQQTRHETSGRVLKQKWWIENIHGLVVKVKVGAIVASPRMWNLSSAFDPSSPEGSWWAAAVLHLGINGSSSPTSPTVNTEGPFFSSPWSDPARWPKVNDCYWNWRWNPPILSLPGNRSAGSVSVTPVSYWGDALQATFSDIFV